MAVNIWYDVNDENDNNNDTDEYDDNDDNNDEDVNSIGDHQRLPAVPRHPCKGKAHLKSCTCWA